MSTSRQWTEQEVILLKMLRPTHTNKEIEDEFQRRHDLGLAGIYPRSTDSIQKKCKRDDITAATTLTFNPSEPFNKRLKELESLQSKYVSKCVRRTRGIMDPSSHARKIVSISDIHVPFSSVDMLREVIDTHGGIPGTWLMMNGDILEMYAASVYPKSKIISALIEYRCAFELVKELRTLFDRVFITSGNHDKRLTRIMKDLGWSVDRAQVLRPDLLARIANGEELDETGNLIAKHDWDNVYYEEQESWYMRIGKTVFFHPSTKPSAAPGSTVSRWAKKFLSRYDADEVDSFVCGHTHKVYEGVINGYKMIEQGTLAGLLAYAFDPRAAYDGNAQNGYAIIYQDAEGNTDFNESHVVYLGEVLPPKKDIAA